MLLKTLKIIALKYTFKDTYIGEAPWSSGKRLGLTIRAMVLGRGFKSRLHLKTRWKERLLDGRKSSVKIKAAKPKIYLKDTCKIILKILLLKNLLISITF